MQKTLLSLAIFCCLMASASQTHSADRLTVVKHYVDTVLDKAGDHYHGSQATPLLASGVDPRTGKPLEWVFPDGRTAVLSNFSAQQNFMRVLVGLSNLTGDDRYQQRAKASVRY